MATKTRKRSLADWYDRPSRMRINVRVDPDDKAWLTAYAREHGKSEAEVIRQLIKTHPERGK